MATRCGSPSHQQQVVDEHRLELRARGGDPQHGHHRAVHAPAQGVDREIRADGLPDFGDLPIHDAR